MAEGSKSPTAVQDNCVDCLLHDGEIPDGISGINGAGAASAVQ